MTPVIGGNRCGCGFKHFWNGKEYDNMPERWAFDLFLYCNGVEFRNLLIKAFFPYPAN